jgi:hypothetical protein
MSCLFTLIMILSKFYFSGIPLSWGIRLALSLRPEMDPISQPRSYTLTESSAFNLTVVEDETGSRV